jgi:hypothetical protein
MRKEWTEFFNEKGMVNKDVVIGSVHPDLPENVVKDLVATYDSSRHEAPSVNGHPEHNKPANGWVKSLRQRGRDIIANMNLLPEHVEDVIKGKFKKRSLSYYFPNARTNPTPGRYHLRHVGWLGAVPPHIKGMPDVAFSDSGRENGIEDNIGFITFSDSEDPEKQTKKEKGMSGEKTIEKTVFDVDQHEKLLESEKKKWHDDHQDKINSLNEKISTLEKEKSDLQKENTTLSETNIKAQVEKDIDALVGTKIKPARRDAVIKNLMEVRKGSEDLYKNFIEDYKDGPDIIETGEDQDANEGDKKDFSDKNSTKLNETDKMFGVTEEMKKKYGNMTEYEGGL